MANTRYITQDGIVIDFRNTISASGAMDALKETAKDFMSDNPNEESYSIAVIDFEKMTSSILKFEVETKVLCTAY
jgi:hypothetical protein